MDNFIYNWETTLKGIERAKENAVSFVENKGVATSACHQGAFRMTFDSIHEIDWEIQGGMFCSCGRALARFSCNSDGSNMVINSVAAS